MKQEKKRDHEERENQDSLDNPRKRVKEDIKGEEYTPFLQEVLDVKGEDEESQHLVLTPPQPGLGTEQNPEQKLDPQFLEYWNTYGSDFLKGAASPEEAWQNCYMWYYYGSQQQESLEEPNSGVNQQTGPEEKLPLEIPDSTESAEEIKKILFDLLSGVVVDESESKQKQRRTVKRDRQKGIDFDESCRSIGGYARSCITLGNPDEAYILLTRWNKLAPDHKITAKEVGLSPDFKPGTGKQEVEDKPKLPEQREFEINGEPLTLTESSGVKGGFHVIFNLPEGQFNVPALVRAPRENPMQSVRQGMQNRRKVIDFNLTPPKILNDPQKDGFYIVEKIPDEFDLQNSAHRKQIIQAFAMMTRAGSEFPVDFRKDNVRFKGNQMIVIDFSESEGLCGDQKFRDESLLELCWKGTRTLGESNDNSEFGKFFESVKPRIPKSWSPNRIDYDETLFYDVQKELKPKDF